MIEFLNKLFGRHSSGATAKERLRLVLMSDHLSLAPEMIDAMKRDLVDVISRYVEVDREKIDVHFEHQDKALAMLANIPITGVNRNGGNGTKKDDEAAPNAGQHHAEGIGHAEPVEARPSNVEASPTPANGNGQRRRRRRKSTQHQNGAAPQTGSPAPAT
ncbi:MAG TPA: cell division topological specificity factor MinE [Candidatus Baltobacteraceae bacterium]|nr:cell division topological specificity factor MinE [Candidatus Baltobacteraceae bacterium]